MTRPMPGPPECTCIGRGNGCLTCLDAIGYDLEAICPTCPVHAGPSYRETKRLTDAECAAHYWQADGECLALDNALIVGWSNHETVTNADIRAETWKRFKDTPHALEES